MMIASEKPLVVTLILRECKVAVDSWALSCPDFCTIYMRSVHYLILALKSLLVVLVGRIYNTVLHVQLHADIMYTIISMSQLTTQLI